MKDCETISLSPEEAYFQAAISLALYRMIQNEIPSEDEGEEDRELDERVMHTIRHGVSSNRLGNTVRAGLIGFVKGLAIVLILVCLCFTSAFAISSDFRDLVYHFCVSTYSDHSEVSLSHETGNEAGLPETTAEIPAFCVSWLPGEDFAVIYRQRTSGIFSTAYQAGNNKSIFLDAYSENCITNIDTEGMTRTTLSLTGKNYELFRKDNRFVLVWHEGQYYLALTAESISEAEAIVCAMSVQVE